MRRPQDFDVQDWAAVAVAVVVVLTVFVAFVWMWLHYPASMAVVTGCMVVGLPLTGILPTLS
jgi:hypothetical protein